MSTVTARESVSAYLGAGLGSVGGNGGASLGTKLEAGVEFFRLHRVRLMDGVSAIIPLEPQSGEDRVSWGLSLPLLGVARPQLQPLK
jgi:hypothetical protein